MPEDTERERERAYSFLPRKGVVKLGAATEREAMIL